jgi:hypothetical protein
MAAMRVTASMSSDIRDSLHQTEKMGKRSEPTPSPRLALADSESPALVED